MTSTKKNIPVFHFDELEKYIRLYVPNEFSFNETLHYLSQYAIDCMQTIEDNKITKLLECNGKPVLIEISQSDESSLLIRFIDGLERNKDDIQQVVNYVIDWFDLGRDLSIFYTMSKNDPLLGELVDRYFGLRIIGIPDLFEALCWAVIGQQINLTFAFTLKKRFVETFGENMVWNGRTYWLFPKPSAFSISSIDTLKKLQFTGKKAEYIVGIAQLMESGKLSRRKLLTGDNKEAEQQLKAIRGVGPWTAHYAMMRCLRDPSAFPIGDVGLQNAMKNRLNRLEKPKPEEIQHIFSKWKNWEAYAVFYLWRSLETT